MKIEIVNEKGRPGNILWIFIGVMYFIAGLFALLSWNDCSTYGEMVKKDTQYKFLTKTCYVKVYDDVYLPKDEYLERSIQRKQEIEIK